MARTKLLDGKLTHEEQLIAEYIEENASDILVNKINKSDKGIGDCWSYIVNCAKEKAKGASGIGIASDVVFGWAIHYFEEDSIKKGSTPKVNTVKTVNPKEVKKKVKAAAPKPVIKDKEKDNMLPGQMTIFDLMGEAK